MPSQSALPFVRQDRPKHYLAVPAIEAVLLVLPEEKDRLHIRLQLKGGYELDIPLKPSAQRKLKAIFSAG